jgi:hydroxymethylbilane synthase
MTDLRQRLVVGTRGSKLALVQTEEILQELRRTNPDLQFEVIEISTRPDVRSQDPLSSFPAGMFVKELEHALLDGVADIAIHSLKDLPTEMPPQLSIAAVGERQDPRDVLVSRSNLSLSELKQGSRLGTSSPRRASQVKTMRRDLDIVPIRGNVDTRLKKVHDGEYDATVMAAAGIQRLGLLSQVTQYFSTQELIPPPGQGALAVQIRADDEQTRRVVEHVNHQTTQIAIDAERAFLSHLGGGCKVPVGAYSEIQSGILEIRGIIIDDEARQYFSSEVSGSPDDPVSLGIKLAERLLDMGAREIV